MKSFTIHTRNTSSTPPSITMEDGNVVCSCGCAFAQNVLDELSETRSISCDCGEFVFRLLEDITAKITAPGLLPDNLLPRRVILPNER